MKTFFFSLILLVFLTSSNICQQYWVEQNSGVTVDLNSVSKSQNANYVGWICGNSGTVIRTTNNGQNWLNATGSGIPNSVSLVNIFAVDPNTAITAGYQGSNTWVWKTTNGGTNWVQVFTQTGGFIDAVWMFSNSEGIMVGDPVGGRWSIWKTTNGGSNWDSTNIFLPQAGTETGYNNSLFYLYSKIWFGTNNSRIYYSSNNGSNWFAEPTTGQTNTFSIWFDYNQSEGVSGGANLLQTTNSGGTWTLLPTPGTGNINGLIGSPLPVDNLDFGFTWFTRSGNNIYFSWYGGTNWTVEYTAPSGAYRHMSQLWAFTGFWAIRTGGGISFHLPFSGIQKISSIVPEHFSLSQNYPNPFNPSTKIKFYIPPLSSLGEGPGVRLIVYDVLGREVASLIPPLQGGQEGLQPGTYEVEWDASNYTSGVYFYKLITSDYTETRKMVLIK
jgi:photosystem II stability/assembly factor-like uncharacterized protein